MILPADTHVAIVDGERFLLTRNRGTATEPVLAAFDEPDVSGMGESGASGHRDTDAKSDA